MELKGSTLTSLMLAATTVGGVTGTVGGGLRAEQQVQVVNERVNKLSFQQSAILKEVENINKNQEKLDKKVENLQEQSTAQGRRLERVLTILEERDRKP